MSDPLPRVLVVDDDPATLRLLRRILRAQFEVSTAGGTSEAIRRLLLERVAAVLSDLDMPDGDGLEVLRVARSVQPSALRVLHTGAPPLALTDHVRSGLVHQVLVKPVAAEHIFGALEAITRQR